MDDENKLPIKFGNSSIRRIIYLYCMIWKNLYGFDPDINYGMMGKLFKPLFEKYSEWQVASLICLHFNWHGATGEDTFTFKILAEKCFPLEWLPKNVNGYKAYIINTLKIDWNDPTQVKEYVVGMVKQYKK